jgi:hypothetical protein
MTKLSRKVREHEKQIQESSCPVGWDRDRKDGLCQEYTGILQENGNTSFLSWGGLHVFILLLIFYALHIHLKYSCYIVNI